VSARDELARRLAALDDAALEALANRGLLRRARKDLTTAAPEVVQESADAVVVDLGGHRVRIGAAGPAGATCTCPATTVCQHVLAAVLWLAAAPEPAGDGDAPVAAASPADELAAIPGDALRAHAGKAGYRWAWQLVDDLLAEDGVRLQAGRRVVIGFARPALTFHYAGGPIESIIIDREPREPARYRVAAVLAWQRAHGREVPAPEPVRGRAGPAGAGEHPTAGATHVAEREESRARLRAAVLALAAECLELGLSHLSGAVRQRFATLATWAQGAEYHRLAPALRRLADHVDLLLERNAAADEHRLLDELVVAVALVRALDAAAEAGTAPAALLGRARGAYDPAAPLEVIGLGARPWRSASGYVGLTAVFWTPATETFVSWSDARPASLAGFDPARRYRAAGPWTGLAAPAAATGRRLRLVGAQLSEAGRLSGSDRTSVAAGPELGAAELAGALRPHRDWADLAAARQGRRTGVLAVRRAVDDYVVLAPAEFGDCGFDPARQVLRWALGDAAGRWWVAEVPFTRFGAPAIERIERLAAAGVAPGTLVVAQLSRRGGDVVAEPVSLVHPGAAAGAAVEALFFATPAGPAGAPRDAVADAPDAPDVPDVTGSGGEEGEAGEAAASAVPRAVRDLRHWTQRTAERGISPATAQARLAELARLAGHAAQAGLTTFGGVVPAGAAPGEDVVRRAVDGLTRAHLLCLEHELAVSG
jgi:hypothetical protein